MNVLTVTKYSSNSQLRKNEKAESIKDRTSIEAHLRRFDHVFFQCIKPLRQHNVREASPCEMAIHVSSSSAQKSWKEKELQDVDVDASSSLLLSKCEQGFEDSSSPSTLPQPVQVHHKFACGDSHHTDSTLIEHDDMGWSARTGFLLAVRFKSPVNSRSCPSSGTFNCVAISGALYEHENDPV
jgi:hypothetical protein